MRRFRTALLVVLALLMPLRGLAAATMGLAPQPVQEQPAHADGGCHHEGQPSEEQQSSHSDNGHSCASCSEHGCCASIIVAAAASVTPSAAARLRIPLGERLAAGFVPDHLDPPPLAL
jgi:hypothetical protein